MKKILTSILLFVAVIMSAQEVPTSFPRKYLIEHFTGAACIYCPEGMYCLDQYFRNSTTPCIWVSHHYGYEPDEYTISESEKIGRTCGVPGAPMIAINRTKITGTSVAFDPRFLPNDGMAELIDAKCGTTAEASVEINHTYDAATRDMTIMVSGQVANVDVTEYLLTVLIKENGLIGKQADEGDLSFEGKGWIEFVHPRVVRDLLCSDALGDKVTVENQAYSKTYTYKLPENFMAENCVIVAYITGSTKKPVINAEEKPVVAGTTGGEHFKWPFGLTEAKAVPHQKDLIFSSVEYSKPSDNKLNLRLIASKVTRSGFYGAMKMVVDLEFNTPDTILPANIDTLSFAEGDVENTFTAGYFDPLALVVKGSHMAYYQSQTLDTDKQQMYHVWRIKNGSVVMDEKGGFVATGKLYNGKTYTITCTLSDETAVENVVFDKAHIEKLMRNGQFIIRIDGVEYDLQGREITR